MLSGASASGLLAQSPPEVVREGRTWKYYSKINNYMDPSENIYLDVCLSGTTEIDGKEYLNCYVWKSEESFSEDSASLIAYMREEQGKVYVRYIADAHITAMENGIDIIPYAPMMALYNHDIESLSQTDVLIFDSNIQVGETLFTTEGDTAGDLFTVSRIEDVDYLGKIFRCYTFNKSDGSFYSFFEGVGDIIGLLPLPGASPITYSADLWHLIQVIENDGTVMFDSSKIHSGITGTTDEANVVKEIYHDLNGIEITMPSERGIYLKTKVLDNGQTRTEKVIIR